MLHLRLKFALAGLLLIGGGALVKYLVGYKDSLWIDWGYMLSVIFGWLALLAVIFSWLPDNTLATGSPPTRLLRVAKRLAVAVGFLAWLVLLVASFVVLDMYSQARINHILATRPTAYATATITAIRLRSSKSGTRRAALISYPAGPRQVAQAIADQGGYYQPGQRLRVKYVLEHPDMFGVASADSTYRSVPEY